MACFVIYSYKGDQDLLEQSLRALSLIVREGEVVSVRDDIFDPLDREFKEKMLKGREGWLAFDYTTSPRNGGLKGPAHAKENIRILREMARGSDDGVVVKLDSDTIILNRHWIDEFAKSDHELAGPFHSQHNYMFGMAYAIKWNLAFLIEKDMEEFPPWVYCFEDFEISSRACRLSSKIKRFSLTSKNSRWVLANPWEIPNGLAADVLNCNRGARREDVLTVMRDTVDNIERVLSLTDRPRSQTEDEEESADTKNGRARHG